MYFNKAHTRGAIFTILPDGGLRQLTHRGKGLLGTEPDWSPDGRWIAFERQAPGKPSRLFKVRPNGTHLTILSERVRAPQTTVTTIADAAWSPDGKRIAFMRFNDALGLVGLFVMRAYGTHVEQVTDSVAPRSTRMWGRSGRLTERD